MIAHKQPTAACCAAVGDTYAIMERQASAHAVDQYAATIATEWRGTALKVQAKNRRSRSLAHLQHSTLMVRIDDEPIPS